MTAEEKVIYKYVDAETREIYPDARAMNSAIERKERAEAQAQAGRKNPEFVQLYKNITPKRIALISRKSPTAVEVLMFLLENMDNTNAVIVSQKTIAETVEKSRKAVNEAIKVLKAEKILAVGRTGTSNFYIINPYMAYQRAHKDKKNVIIKATIILGEAEASKIFDEFQKAFSEPENDSFRLKNTTTRYLRAPKPSKIEDETDIFEDEEYQISDQIEYDEEPPDDFFDEEPEFPLEND